MSRRNEKRSYFSTIHEVIILAKKNYNIIFRTIRNSIYWGICPVSTFFNIEGKFFRKVFVFFYNFLPNLVVGKRKGKRSFASLKGMEGGELLWSNLLPVGMRQIYIDLIVTAKTERGTEPVKVTKILTADGIKDAGTQVSVLNGAGALSQLKKSAGNVIYGKGNGHHVGFSQHGAMEYAKNDGWDYITILKHYYQGVKIEGE